jgi:alcohol dehydrogenase class IV
MNFEFATAARIIFGAGKLSEIGGIAAEYGTRALVVTSSAERARPLLERLDAAKIAHTAFLVAKEPDIALVQAGVRQYQESGAQFVIGMGGGSAIDAGKAIAALAANPGDIFDYLEVIGRAQKLAQPSVPYIAVPTTAGTGAEVTRNAVVSSPEHKLKVSLRSPSMLPKVALVDPELTYGLPKPLTAATGMDALTQVIEPYVSNAANPITDALALKGIILGASAIQRAYHDEDPLAREHMALTSLFGGLALANAKLGAVHGFAGVIGGMFDAPHGAICARLLPLVMEMNVRALLERQRDSLILARYADIARVVSGDYLEFKASAWAADLAKELEIPGLGQYGVTKESIPGIVEKSKNASSMKGNPIALTDDELTEIMTRAL